MLKTLDWKSLECRFSDPADLPQLPSAAIQLTQLLNSGRATIRDCEKVIVGSTGLTANVLKAANHAAMGITSQPITTIHQAMMLLGQDAVSNIATSMWVQSTLNSKFARTELDSGRYNQHCAFVGFFAYHVFATRMQKEKFVTSWQGAELFTVGILHDVAKGLLAILEPELFRELKDQAITKKITIAKAFHREFDMPIGKLGSMILRTWGLPPRFAEAIEFMDDPSSHETERIPFMCLKYADTVAVTHGFPLLPGLTVAEATEEMLDEVGLPPETLQQAVMAVSSQVRAYSTH